MSDIAIRVENLGKSYRIASNKGASRYRTLRNDLLSLPKNLWSTFRGQREQQETVWALQDVSFEVQVGEVVGVIGRNGAGKSTLLKLLSRIAEPTTGRAEVYGRVGSLLEVGTGFHPELTGRENVFLSGAVLGMTRREVQKKFDEIVAFAEVEKYIDEPVKHYSSGMYMRLAFAVAAHLEPEVLVVDEVLAVGDVEFQKKCLGKMGEVSKEGRTILFVSHNMGAIEYLCSNCLLLDQGRMVAKDETNNIIQQYLTQDTDTETVWNVNDECNLSLINPYFNPIRMSIVDSDLQVITRSVTAKEQFGVLIEGFVETIDTALNVGIAIYTLNSQLLFWSFHNDVEEEKWTRINKGYNKLVVWITPHFLNEGIYKIELISGLYCITWLCRPEVNAPSVKVSIQGGLSDSPYWMSARPGLLAPILLFENISEEYE